jgi:ComF family protein
MKTFSKLWHSALHLFYPHTCTGCGSDLLPQHELLCGQCIVQLPHTGYAALPDNPVEKMFTGRLPLQSAAAQFYFTKDALVQHLIHQLKYKGNTDIGLYMGRLMGQALLETNRFCGIDCLVPLPMYAAKERQRGYNQATILCRGMAEAMSLPISAQQVIRQRSTQTQTRKQRTGRWQNVEGSFAVAAPEALAGKHILLVDDVVTTGATLDACGNAILQVAGARISIATLAFAVGC